MYLRAVYFVQFSVLTHSSSLGLEKILKRNGLLFGIITVLVIIANRGVRSMGGRGWGGG